MNLSLRTEVAMERYDIHRTLYVLEIDIIIFIKTYSTTREMPGWMIYVEIS